MRAIGKYKAMVDEVGRMMMVFANLDKFPILEQGWTLAAIQKAQADIMDCANTAADQIKKELIGDGDKAKFRGRLETTFFELGADPNFAPSYFPVFDEAIFELPSKDYPDRNKEMVDALTDVYGGDAGKVMLALQVLLHWANFIVEDVSKMLAEVCKFVGYTPEPQQGEKEQQKDLHYYCHKGFISALQEAELIPDGNGYGVLGAFAGTLLSKAANQLMNNKNGDGKPRGYKKVDELLQG